MTPDSTVIGPVIGATSRGVFGRDGFALALLLARVAGTCRRVVDDDAALPALACAALAGPHRADLVCLSRIRSPSDAQV